MSVSFKLPVFEGPLDLLLHLIEKNQVDIYEIPIVEITRQYLEYVQALAESDLDDISEFVIMAATLLSIKSRMLLPAEEEEEEEAEDPRAELVERLLQYKMMKQLSGELREQSENAGDHYYRREDLPAEVAHYVPPVDTQELLADVTLERLKDIFRFVSRRQADRFSEDHRKYGRIVKEKVRIVDVIAAVMRDVSSPEGITFRQLLMKQPDKMALITAFLAVLELMKNGSVRLEEMGDFNGPEGSASCDYKLIRVEEGERDGTDQSGN